MAPPADAAPAPVLQTQAVSMSHAWFHRVVLREASRLRKARREALTQSILLIGAHCVAKLLKAEVVDRYSIRMKTHAQEPMRACDIDEPSLDSPVVEMLGTLPPEESLLR